MKRAWRPPVVIAVLLVLVTILFLLSRAPDLAVLEHLQEALQDVSLHEAELGRDVLLARAGMNANYDALAADRAHLSADLKRIDGTLATASPRVAVELAPARAALARAAGDQLLAVEDFKSENAILRNSLAYLTAEGPLQQEALEARGDPHDFGRLAYAALQYLKEPSAAVGARIETLLARIERGGPTPVEFRTFFAHAHKLVEELPAVDALVAVALGGGALDRAMQFQSRIAAQGRALNAKAQPALYALYGVSVLLVAYVAMQVRRLRLAAIALAAKNRELRAEAQERQRAHDRLAARERELRSITDFAQEAILLVGPDQRIRAWSLGAQKLFGLAAEEAVGRPVAAVLRTRASAAVPASPRTTQDLDLLDTELLRSDGTPILAELTYSPWRDVDGENLTVIVRDVGWKRPLREQARQNELRLIQANHMGSLGVLLHGKAHAMANPIQAVRSYAAVLAGYWRDILGVLDRAEAERPLHLGGQRYLHLRPGMELMATDLLSGATHVEKLVLELHKYGRQSPVRRREAFDVPALMERAMKLTLHLAEKKPVRIELSPATVEGLPAARGDEHEVEQVLVNLICNAVEALDPVRGGDVRLGAEWLPRRGVICMSVCDNGSGIAPDVLARILDLYYTTKAHGSGLGVPISMALVRAQGGRMRFETTPGAGTTVRVDLCVDGCCGLDAVLADVAERVAADSPPGSLALPDASTDLLIAANHVELGVLVEALVRQALAMPSAPLATLALAHPAAPGLPASLAIRGGAGWRPNLLALEAAAEAAGIRLCAADGEAILSLPLAEVPGEPR